MKIPKLFTAIITPFLENQEIDWNGWRLLLRRQLKGGVNGIVVLGTTGENPTINPKERVNLIQIALEETKEKGSVWVGTGHYSTKETILLTQEAATLGAQGALIVTPYYNKPTQEGLFQHFATVAEAVPDFPICLYNVPGRTGVNLAPSTLFKLADSYAAIVAIKEASGQLSQIAEIIHWTHEKKNGFVVLSGDDALTLPIMALGGSGVISVASNLLPNAMAELVDALSLGDLTTARMWHQRLLPYFQMMFIESNPIPIKEMIRFFHLPAGPCRPPLTQLNLSNREKLLTFLSSNPSWINPSWLKETPISLS